MVIVDDTSELTRFAGNEIHQSVAERSRHVRVRLIDGGRIGVGEVRGHGERARRARVRRGGGEPARHHARRRCHRCPLRDRRRRRSRRIRGGDRRGDAAGTRRARRRSSPSAASAHGINAYGALSTTHDHHRDRHERGTAQGGDVDAGEPRVGRTRRRRRRLRVASLRRTSTRSTSHGLAAEVVDTCERNQGATAIEPGDYEVDALAVRGDRPARTSRLGRLQRARGAGAPKLHAHRREAHERA